MLRTLIVEDNVSFRQSFKQMLQEEFPSMEICEASDGEEALRQLGAFHPGLVFMDIKLPGENGLSLTRKIKTQYSQTNVIILTSYDLPEYREAAKQGGASHFCSKGSTHSSEILTMVNSIVTHRVR